MEELTREIKSRINTKWETVEHIHGNNTKNNNPGMYHKEHVVVWFGNMVHKGTLQAKNTSHRNERVQYERTRPNLFVSLRKRY